MYIDTLVLNMPVKSPNFIKLPQNREKKRCARTTYLPGATGNRGLKIIPINWSRTVYIAIYPIWGPIDDQEACVYQSICDSQALKFHWSCFHLMGTSFMAAATWPSHGATIYRPRSSRTHFFIVRRRGLVRARINFDGELCTDVK